MNSLVLVFAHAIAAILTALWNRKEGNKQDRKLFIALMIGGFIWSQLQTEYLIFRIKKNTEKALGKNFSHNKVH